VLESKNSLNTSTLTPHHSARRIFLSLLSSISLGLLIFLSAFLMHDGGGVAPPPMPNPNWAADFPQRIVQVTDALARLSLPLPTPTTEAQGAGSLRWTRRRYALAWPAMAEPGLLEDMFEPVRGAAPGVSVSITRDPGTAVVQIGIDGLLTHTVVVHQLAHAPRAAIIIAELGDDLQTARAFVSINAPLTLAILPLRPFTKEIAALAAIFGREVLLQLPMEAESEDDFGAAGVLHADAARGELLQLLDTEHGELPHAVGANNRGGARFTMDRERTQWVLEYLKEQKLFFVDSRTTPDSVACDVAAQLAVACAARDLPLDETDDADAVRAQLEVLEKLAHIRGDVIAIGHPRPATLEALQGGIAGFAAAGIEVVPVSSIVQR
jgi:uncharacterized protein